MEALRFLQLFVSALNHADINELTNLLGPDATAFLPLDSTPSELVGREAIKAAFVPLFQELRNQGSGPDYMHLVAHNVHVQSFGRIAIITFDAGSGPVTSRRTLVIERSSGGWHVTHFHGSNIRQRTKEAGA